MEQLNLVLTLPQGALTATNLGIEGSAGTGVPARVNTFRDARSSSTQRYLTADPTSPSRTRADGETP